MTGDLWSKMERVIRQSQSIREINEAHEMYLDKMLNAFFVLKKVRSTNCSTTKNTENMLRF
jgi:hypothetical protein